MQFKWIALENYHEKNEIKLEPMNDKASLRELLMCKGIECTRTIRRTDICSWKKIPHRARSKGAMWGHHPIQKLTPTWHRDYDVPVAVCTAVGCLWLFAPRCGMKYSWPQQWQWEAKRIEPKQIWAKLDFLCSTCLGKVNFTIGQPTYKPNWSENESTLPNKRVSTRHVWLPNAQRCRHGAPVDSHYKSNGLTVP